MSKRHIRLTIDGKTPLQSTIPAATGPWLGEPESEQRHRALMKMYADEEERAVAANGGRLPSFATSMGITDGSAEYDEPPPRQRDDPPDPHHSPELVDPEQTLTDTYDLDKLHEQRGVTFEDGAA